MTDPYRTNDGPWVSPGHSPPPGPETPAGAPAPAAFALPTLPKQPLEPLAVASVVASPVAPLGLGLGIAALRRIRRSRRRGGTLAVGGIVLSSLFLVAAALAVATFALDGTFDRARERPVAGNVAAARTAAPVNLAVGNCVATLPVTERVGEVTLTPCAEGHQLQVIDRIEVAGGDYPGPPALFQEAAQRCQEAFEGLGAATPSWPAGFTPWHLVPSPENWQAGQRHIICFARSTAGPVSVDLVGS